MIYITKNISNSVYLKLNSTPVNNYSGTYLFNCKHIQSNTDVNLTLVDGSTMPNNYQKFTITSGDSNNFFTGQYQVNIYDVTASTVLITTQYFTVVDTSSSSDIYFMVSGDTAVIYNASGQTATVPNTPIGLQATLQPSGDQINLTWFMGSTNTEAYDLWRKKDAGAYVNVNNNIRSYIYLDQYLDFNSTYTYKLRAKNSVGFSTFTAEVSALTSYSATTATTAVFIQGSGATIATLISGNSWNVYTPTVTGVSLGQFVNYTGATEIRLEGIEDDITYLSGQTDLKLNKTTFNTYTGTTAPATYAPIIHLHSQYMTSGGTNNLINIALSPYWDSGETTAYVQSQISGITSPSWSGLTGLPTENNDLMNLLAEYTLTGTTATLRQDLVDHTGNTSIHTPYSAIIMAISAATSGLTSSWSGLTGLPTDNSDLVDLLSGYSLTSHTHTQYALQSNINTYTGTTAPGQFASKLNFNAHTGDSTIHFTKSSINLDDLGDVQITTPSDGSLLMYSGGTWRDEPAVDIFQYVDNLEILIRNGDEVSGITNQFSTKLNTSVFNTYTGTTAPAQFAAKAHVHAISGVTGLQTALNGKTDTGTTYQLQQDFNSHTGDTTIHFKMSGISITESQVQGLVGKYSLTGHTHSQYQPISGMSIYLTGITAPMVTGITASLYAPIIHTHQYSAITNTPDLSVYQPISGMSIYLTGITAPMVTGITDSLYAYKVHTHPYSAITNTPDLSVYQPISGMTDYQPVSAMTDYYTSTQVDGLISGFTTGYTFVASGGTAIGQVGNQITIYSPTGSSSNVVLVGSGATVVDNISGDTWVVYSPTPTGGTGSTVTLVASGACEVNNISGDTWVIYAPSGGTGGVSEATFTGYTGVTAPATYMPLFANISNVTGTTYTILTTDKGKILQFTNTGATTITIPSGTSFAQGFQVTLVSYGNGTTSGVKTLAAGGGATVKSANSALKLSTIFGACTIYKTPTANTWVAFGDLTA